MTQLQTLDWPAPWPVISDAHIPQLNGHREEWISSVARGLRQRVYLVRARQGEAITGVLPLHLVKGPIFGRFLVSIPYLNTGGVWAKDVETATRLIDVACDLADQLNVRYLELRHEQAVEHPRLNFSRTDKVHMRLALPDSDEALMASFKSKLRSQIKKTGEYGLSVRFGGAEFLRDFYNVFAHNMRDLGTPVFPRGLFAAILEEFGDQAELCIVSKDSRAVAGALLVHADGVSEVPSASSLRAFNRTGANMLMYRHLLARSIERGSRTFDFGRSSQGSGTYKFKAQWGAQPHPAVWQYYVRKGSPEDMRPEASGKQRMVQLWQKLPVWLTRLIGPPIVRGIP
ncbi:FemAB family XrtA/PEP-CTERM system-associated protein [Roseimaritima ulvae]|uniref:FemAB family protein n=1 Tax=Roseimaritima ulvae TaxID=980254 RepID=A0A5B9QXC2_9BACT|nr:FemAB family XrtA/PEP-CTERM system-associated protein [Roseimaritima ulvae]QEG42529.1 FemAB family protein [Roseimaritima ulvae]